MKFDDPEFRWNDWNTEHIARHNVSPQEAEQVVRRAPRGYPRKAAGETFLVRGQTADGFYLQVSFVLDPPPDTTLYVIHARPLSEPEKRRYFPKRKR